MSRLLVRDCAQVVTLDVDGRVSVVEDGSVLVEDGRVLAVGPRSALAGSAGLELSARGGVVTPGLVDCHTHLGFGGHRADDLQLRSQGASYQEIAAQGGGIASTVEATRGLSSERLRSLVLGRMRAAVRLGTTTLEAKSGYGLDYETERAILCAYRDCAAEVGLTVVATYLGLHACPAGTELSEYCGQCVETVLPALHAEGLVDAVDAFVEPGFVGEEEAGALAAQARRLGLPLRLHVDQFGDHGGAGLAARLGASTADHLEHTGREGIAQLAGAGVAPVLLPGSVLGLGLGRYADARAMVAAGLPVALASDFNPGSSPVLSLQTVMGLACRMMRMTPAEALAGCTVHAARALGLADRGRLAPGERADVALWEAADYRELAVYYGLPLCKGVLVAGEPRLAGE